MAKPLRLVDAEGMRIICGVHESPSSRRAATMAAQLANESGGEVVLVNVVQAGALLAPRRGHGEPLPQQAPGVSRRVERAAAMLEAMAGEVSSASGASVRWEVYTGYPPARMAAACSDLEADLVVLGQPRRSRWRRTSAITRRIVGDGRFPLLLVPGSVAVGGAARRADRVRVVA